MKIISNTLIGSKHLRNEDLHYISPELKSKCENYKLMMIMDGISAYQNASTLTKMCNDYLTSISEKKMFTLVSDMFNGKNIDFMRNISMFAVECKSGSTISLLILEQNSKKCLTYNMGDSPIYLFRKNILLPIYGDCSLPVYNNRNYEKLSKFNINENIFYQIKPNEELKLLREANRNSFNSNVIMSSLPFRPGLDKGHYFKYSYETNDMILMGSDGFLSNYLYPNFEQIYTLMAFQIKKGGQPILDNFIKLHETFTNDDSTGIFIQF